jgi:hypothetical protein
MRATILFACLAATAATQGFPFDTLIKYDLPRKTTPVGTSAMAFGDLDRDGDQDLVVGGGLRTASREQPRLYRNEGYGRFTDVTATQLPSLALMVLAVRTADIDGDSDLDLLFANDGPNVMLRNDGNGVFTADGGAIPPILVSTNDAAFGDVDRDGDLDLVTAHGYQAAATPPTFRTSDFTRLFLNDGSGRFVDSPSRMPVSRRWTAGLVLADLDGDLDLDAYCANLAAHDVDAQDHWLRNDGSGNFTQTSGLLPIDAHAASAAAGGDLDRDGDVDLVIAAEQGTMLLYRNDGGGRFVDASSWLPALGPTPSIQLRDFDGDGDLDLATALATTPLCTNDGSGRFAPSTAAGLNLDLSTTLAAGDADGNGTIDLVYGTIVPRGLPDVLFRNRGDGTFVGPAPHEQGRLQYLADGRPWDSAAVDVDGDGDLDIVRGVPAGERYVLFRNDGLARFATIRDAFPSRTDTNGQLAIGDVDRDGDADVVSAAYQFRPYTPQLVLFLNDGTGKFQDATATNVPPGTAFIDSPILTDLDGDRDLDIVTIDGVAGPTGPAWGERAWINDGSGKFTEETMQRFPNEADPTSIVLAADVDQDGDVDLFIGNGWINVGNQQDKLWLNDGRGYFTRAPQSALPLENLPCLAAVFADVDGDRDPDLVIADRYDAPARLLINNGRGTFTPSTGLQGRARLPAAFDRDGDGDVDLLLGRDLYDNDGSGNFVPVAPGPPYQLSMAQDPAIGDFDGDGDIDLAHEQVEFNLHRQIMVPLGLRAGGPLNVLVTARPGRAQGLQAAAPFVALGTMPRPVQLPPFGAFWLDLPSLIALPPHVIPSPAGVLALAYGLPTDPTWIGRDLCLQFGIALGTTLDSWRLSNVTVDPILR